MLGDPCAAPNFLEVCKAVKSKSPQSTIIVSTNGGLRNEKFWHDLAHCLTANDIVIFAIDGLKDTNHIYRVNVDYEKVISNATAFINAGGTAHWQFIPFKHNQHQVNEAESIANSLGFKSFFIKPSYRFVLDNMLGVERYGANNTLLEPPTDNDKVHPLVRIDKKFTTEQWKHSSNNSKIECYAKRTSSIYIDYQGRLFPCCPISSGMFARQTIDMEDDWERIWNNYGDNKINLHHENWDDVVNGMMFTCIQDSWDKDYSTGRLLSCAGSCSNSDLQFNKK